MTALQMTAAVGAVANGGYLMRPRIVRQIEDPQGRIVREFKPFAVRRVLEPETVDILIAILREVVTDGTGRRAAIPGYSVAGKTGTAQKVDAAGAYSMIDHVASFVGFAPASRPAIVVLASLDTPRGPNNQGGQVAAPLFAKVAEAALRILTVPPEDDARVIHMVPYDPDHRTRVVRHQREPLPPPSTAPRHMPDLRGRSAREAAIAAARRGLIVELSGSGRVVEQTPAPGSEIATGLRMPAGAEHPATSSIPRGRTPPVPRRRRETRRPRLRGTRRPPPRWIGGRCIRRDLRLARGDARQPFRGHPRAEAGRPGVRGRSPEARRRRDRRRGAARSRAAVA